jgi:hypothetical protein
VENVDDADLEAMDLLLRMMYGSQIGTVDVHVILQSLHLADRYLVCKSAVLPLVVRLSQVRDDAITPDVVEMALGSRSSGAGIAGTLPAPFVTRCAMVFSNVASVVRTPELLARFCNLSHAAVLFWAESPLVTLEVASENDVVFLLSAWVKASHASAGVPCTASELKKVVDVVRLEECGPA